MISFEFTTKHEAKNVRKGKSYVTLYPAGRKPGDPPIIQWRYTYDFYINGKNFGRHEIPARDYETFVKKFKKH